MTLPRWIPKAYREMMVSFRPATSEDDVDDLFLLTQEQTEQQMQKLINSDKGRAIANNAKQIDKVKSFFKEAKRDDDKKRIEEWLDKLYVERFGLLRDEYLNFAKRTARGMQLKSALEKIPGSPEWLKERKQNKNKNKPKQ